MRFELGKWVETPWDSLFNNFDTELIIELSGEVEDTGPRKLRLKVARRPDELPKIRNYIEHASDKSESIQVPWGMAQVLELEYEEKEKQGRYHMIFDPEGVRVEPMPPPPPFPAFFQVDRMRISPKEEAERFGRLEVQGKQDMLFDVLRLIEKRLHRVSVVVVAGEPVLHGDIGIGRLIPFSVMGGGMVRLTSLVLQIANASNGVVLIDEIENGLHHSVMRNVWRAVGETARRFNTQVFATTHSFECIESAHKAFRDSGIYDFRLHRLDRVKDVMSLVTYDQEALEGAIETGLEVR
jgi:hypothetical protein